MFPPSATVESGSEDGGDFQHTEWTVVLQAGSGSSEQATAALEEICRSYWFPLYAFVRHKGYSREEAEDLVQEFFACFLAKNYLAQADRAKGKFRTFLLASLTHFLENNWNRQHTLKRGGRQRAVSWDAQCAEASYVREPRHDLTPEKLFERRWALHLLEQTQEALRREYIAAKKGSLFEALQPCLTGETPRPAYRTIGLRVGLTEGAVKVAVHRLREEFGERLRAELRRTVTGIDQLEDEMQHLLAILRE